MTLKPTRNQLPIVIGITLVSASAGAGVSGYPDLTALALAVLLGLSLIAVGITLGRYHNK